MKSLDLASIPSHTKLEIAVHQLDRAVALLLDEHDCISAITLAGAAEEILGEIVKREGGTSAHQELIDESVALTWHAPGGPIAPRMFHEMFAHYRNELKHHREGLPIAVTPECAFPVVDRAVENLHRLEVFVSPLVRRYLNFRMAR